jgi:hypothetical protein
VLKHGTSNFGPIGDCPIYRVRYIYARNFIGKPIQRDRDFENPSAICEYISVLCEADIGEFYCMYGTASSIRGTHTY